MEQVNPAQNDPERFVDEGVLADRRARRAELAEAELRERLAGAEQRVAELEQIADQSSRARAELEQRTKRDLEIAAVLGEAADAVRAAREAVDHEIHAREAAEAALRAERSAARDAATAAIVSSRVRSSQETPPAPTFQNPGPLAQPPSAPTPETEELLAGLAKAADRLRAQTPSPADGVAPIDDRPPEQSAPPVASAPTAQRGGGGLVGRAARALRKLRSERP